jgi:hypothetical protein
VARVGGLRDCRFCQVLLGLVTSLFVVTLLIVTNVWNPFPSLVAWWDRLNALSTPPPPWTQRLGGPPDRTAVMTGGQAVAAIDGNVTAYDARTGRRIWTINAFWGLPARDIVVLRQQGTNPDHIGSPDTGYDVVEAETGKVVWGQRDAQAVWAFDDQIVDLVCGDASCALRGYKHLGGGQVQWTIPLPHDAHTIHGPDPALVQARDPADWFSKARSGSPPALPRVFGLKINDTIHILDTVAHQDVRQVVPDLQTWVSITNQTLVLTSATPDETGCRFEVRGFNAITGAVDFAAKDVDVGTVDGAGCSQHRDPIGAAGWLVGKDPLTNDPQLIDAANGDVRWTGVPSERVLSTDGQLAAILTADRHTVQVIDLQISPAHVVWTGSFGLDPQAAITSRNVVIRDGDQSHLTVLSHDPGQARTDVKTTSVVVGFGPSGVILASGRRIGVLAVPAG